MSFYHLLMDRRRFLMQQQLVGPTSSSSPTARDHLKNKNGEMLQTDSQNIWQVKAYTATPFSQYKGGDTLL